MSKKGLACRSLVPPESPYVFLRIPARIAPLTFHLPLGARGSCVIRCVEVLLPIAAVAVGMTVLGLVFHIIASGAA
jgi:hypothetical protein